MGNQWVRSTRKTWNWALRRNQLRRAGEIRMKGSLQPASSGRWGPQEPFSTDKWRYFTRRNAEGLWSAAHAWEPPCVPHGGKRSRSVQRSRGPHSSLAPVAPVQDLPNQDVFIRLGWGYFASFGHGPLIPVPPEGVNSLVALEIVLSRAKGYC